MSTEFTRELVISTVEKRYPDLSFQLTEYRNGYILDSVNTCMYIFVNKDTPLGFISILDCERKNEISESFVPKGVECNTILIDHSTLRHIPIVDNKVVQVTKITAPHEDASYALEFFEGMLKHRYGKYAVTQIVVYLDGVMAISTFPEGILHFRPNTTEQEPSSYEVVFQHTETHFEFLGVLPYDAKVPDPNNKPDLKVVK